jgi:hypothetical protein
MIIEACNSKTALFPLALLPQFVVPQPGPTPPQFLLLGLIVTLSAIPGGLFVDFFANKAATLIRGNPKLGDKRDKISGTILISLGAYFLSPRVPKKNCNCRSRNGHKFFEVIAPQLFNILSTTIATQTNVKGTWPNDLVRLL